MSKSEFELMWNKASTAQRRIMMKESNFGVGKRRLFKRQEITQLESLGWGYLNEFQKAAIVNHFDMGYFDRLNLITQ